MIDEKPFHEICCDHCGEGIAWTKSTEPRSLMYCHECHDGFEAEKETTE